MKRLFATVLAGLAGAGTGASHPDPSEQWWAYLASYEDGPGATRLNLALRKVTPLIEYPHLVVTGTTYASSRDDGFPETPDLKRLNELEQQIVAGIAAHTPCIHAGTFTHNFEQLHYVYVKSPAGIEHALSEVYARQCPDCRVYTNIKQDPSWSDYADFLFPSPAILEHYGVTLD